MARTKISEFSATPNDNTDIDGIDIAEGCAPSGINNAIRELMSQLKDFQTGSAGDPFNGAINGTVGATTPSTVVATQVDITGQGDLRLQDTTGGEYVALQAPSALAASYTLTLPVDDGTAGQALITDGSGVLSWSSAASGDVYGPGSATDNAVARYDGTTGKIIQNSAVTIADDGATVIAANSTSDGLRITQTGTGNALVVEDFTSPDASPFVIDNSGGVIVGSTTGYTFGTSTKPIFQVNGITNSTSSIGVSRWQTGISPAILVLAKSRSGTVGTQGVVSNGDNIGNVTFDADDGTAFIPAASITAAVDGTPGTNDMPGRLVFSTTADGASSPTERMRIRSEGGVSIGGAGAAGYTLLLQKAMTGSATVFGMSNNGQVQSDATTSVYYYRTSVTTAATAFTVPNLFHYHANQSTLGAGSSVTSQYGFAVGNTLTGATNNYGFHSDIASGTGRWNFYAAGTADNYFAGNVGVGGAPSTLLHVNNASAKIRIGVDASSQYTDIYRDNATGFTVYNAAQAATFRGHVWQLGGSEAMRIASTGVISLGAAPGAESLRVTPVASAVNYYNITGGVTTGSPYIAAQGSDANIHSQYLSKGTYGHIFNTGSAGNFQFYVAHTASAVNYLQVTGGTTGNAATLSVVGSDTNIDLALTPKGTGVLKFGTYTAGVVTQAGYITIKDAAGNTRRLLVG